MPLDTSTLIFAGGAVAFSSGFFMLCYWALDRAAWSAFLWALANCVAGCCVMLLPYRAVVPPCVAMIAPQLLNLCAVQVFVAARIFNRRSINPYPVVGAVLAWMAAQLFGAACGWPRFAMNIGAGGCGFFFAAAALEFWLGRAERLQGRIGLIITLASFSASILLSALAGASATTFPSSPANDWFHVINLTGLAYPVSVTMFLTAMLKQRASAALEVAALSDPLTGLANRRAFLDRARRVLETGGRDGAPVALLAFDLDHFKRVNDTFGHATGDAALVTFAKVLSDSVRATNIVARIGGEEFVAVLPGVSDRDAVTVADRVRDNFRREAKLINDRQVGATVSVGVAIGDSRNCTVLDLLAKADAALYRAKHAGRNCVVLSGAGSGDPRSFQVTLPNEIRQWNDGDSPGNHAPTT